MNHSTAAELVSSLRDLDIKIWVEGDKLRYNAPEGALTPTLRDQLIEQKAEVLTLLREASEAQLRLPPIRSIPRGGNLAASFAQQRLWILDQLGPDNSAYNLVIARQLVGPLDVAALEQSLNEIVRRHESLRTTFVTVDGEPIQVIAPSLTLGLVCADLTQLPHAQRESEARQRARLEAQRPFDLKHGPLLRAILLRLDEQEHVLLLAMHHIVSDNWSITVLERELAALYAAFRSGQSSPLPEPRIQYADFAHWQREWLQGVTLEKQLSYWKKQLADSPQTLELPTDRPRRQIAYRGATHYLTLSRELTEAVNSLAREENATLFMALLAVFNTLLYRYTGQTDLNIGVPIAGRNHVETEGMIGFFVNTVVMRTDLSGTPTFRQLLGRVRQSALGAYDHQDLPFEKLVQELNPERNLNITPLFQVMFNLLGMPNKMAEIPGLQISSFEFDRGLAQFELSLELAETDDGLHCQFRYFTDLFDAATIARMARHFHTLVEVIVQQPDQPISQLALLTEDERRQLLYDWNDTAADYPQDRCVYQLFEEQVSRTPDAIAVVGDSLQRRAEEQITYRELNQSANQLARYLRKLGLGPGAYVGISIERTVDMVIGLLGILKAGGAYIPLDPAFPRERLAFMLQDAQVSMLLTQQTLLAELPPPGPSTHVVCLDTEWDAIAQEPTEAFESRATAYDLAYILYTSGSTGKPKGVQIPHRALTNFLLAMQKEPGLTTQDILLSVTTLSFDIAGLELYLPLITGARVVIVSRHVAADGALLLQKFDECGATVMQATPATWQMLIDSGWKRYPSLKMLCGGEAMPRDLANQMLERGGSLWNMYGPTETTIWSSTYEVKHGDDPIHLGHPIANTQFYILDSQSQPAPIGVPGELYIGGDGMALGYLNRLELTTERFLPNPFIPGSRIYRTGDLARYHSDGTIEFLGRADFQVKVRGFRIELGDIESALLQHDRVRQAVVVAREDRPGDKRLVGYIIADHEPAPTASELRTFLQDKLPDYMIPSRFLVLGALPLTPNGKVDRRALPEPHTMQFELASNFVAPCTVVERQLATIWEETLHVKPIGVHNNFFELGGHSILAIELFSKIEKVFGERPPLTALFQSPTIAQLAKVLCADCPPNDWSTLVAIQPGGDKPPFFCVHGFGGGVLDYGELARLLGPDQPFFGLQARGVDGLAAPRTRIEAMAGDYVEAIRTIQAHGPYRLGGYCLGGVIAFEMARQLRSQGETVSLVAVFEGYAPTHTSTRERFWQRRWLFNFVCNAPYWLRDYLRLGRRQVLVRLRTKLRGLTHHLIISVRGQPAEINLEDYLPDVSRIPLLNRKMMELQLRAVSNYSPGPDDSSVTLFRVQSMSLFHADDPQLGWGKLALGGVKIRMIGGGHNTILEQPHVQSLAEQLKASIQEAQRPAINHDAL